MLADAAVEPNFQPVGVVIICGALVADAFVGNTQESLMACVHSPDTSNKAPRLHLTASLCREWCSMLFPVCVGLTP